MSSQIQQPVVGCATAKEGGNGGASASSSSALSKIAECASTPFEVPRVGGGSFMLYPDGLYNGLSSYTLPCRGRKAAYQEIESSIISQEPGKPPGYDKVGDSGIVHASMDPWVDAYLGHAIASDSPSLVCVRSVMQRTEELQRLMDAVKKLIPLYGDQFSVAESGPLTPRANEASRRVGAAKARYILDTVEEDLSLLKGSGATAQYIDDARRRTVFCLMAEGQYHHWISDRGSFQSGELPGALVEINRYMWRFKVTESRATSVEMMRHIGVPIAETSKKLLVKNGAAFIACLNIMKLVSLLHVLCKISYADASALDERGQEVPEPKSPSCYQYVLDYLAGVFTDDIAVRLMAPSMGGTVGNCWRATWHDDFNRTRFILWTLLTLTVILIPVVAYNMWRAAVWTVKKVKKLGRYTESRARTVKTNLFGLKPTEVADECDDVHLYKHLYTTHTFESASGKKINVRSDSMATPVVPSANSDGTKIRQEMAFPGCQMKKIDLPRYVCKIYFDGIFQSMGFRYGKVVVTTTHTVAIMPSDATVITISAKKGDVSWVHQTRVARSWSPHQIITTPFPDVSFICLSDTEWNTLGMTSVEVARLGERSSMAVTCVGTTRESAKTTMASSGVARWSATRHGLVSYQLSTSYGWSGTPVVSGAVDSDRPKVVAIHQTGSDGPEGQYGFPLSRIADWMESKRARAAKTSPEGAAFASEDPYQKAEPWIRDVQSGPDDKTVNYRKESSWEYFRKFMKDHWTEVATAAHGDEYFVDEDDGAYYVYIAGRNKPVMLTEDEFEELKSAKDWHDFDLEIARTWGIKALEEDRGVFDRASSDGDEEDEVRREDGELFDGYDVMAAQHDAQESAERERVATEAAMQMASKLSQRELEIQRLKVELEKARSVGSAYREQREAAFQQPSGTTGVASSGEVVESARAVEAKYPERVSGVLHQKTVVDESVMRELISLKEQQAAHAKAVAAVAKAAQEAAQAAATVRVKESAQEIETLKREIQSMRDKSKVKKKSSKSKKKGKKPAGASDGGGLAELAKKVLTLQQKSESAAGGDSSSSIGELAKKIADLQKSGQDFQ